MTASTTTWRQQEHDTGVCPWKSSVVEYDDWWCKCSLSVNLRFLLELFGMFFFSAFLFLFFVFSQSSEPQRLSHAVSSLFASSGDIGS